VKKTMKNAGLVYTILFIVFAAICTLGYAVYLIYKLGKVLKSNVNENSEKEEMAERSTEAGEREVLGADTKDS